MKREISMTGADALPMLSEIEQQDDVRVARILRLRWDIDNDEEYAWSTNRCTTCNGFLYAGDVGHVWGKPFNDSDLLIMMPFCGHDQCIERAMEAWADEIRTDVMAAYFGYFGDDDLELE